ncbi:hypothetical protein [Roseateles sp.]|uniref:hypothetical protein n=1 Tax=Roseateles sp. TaxID=1971397 RepID=UPI002E05B96C|nr:hypothetical protein [Roseateles sp.]
MNAPLPEHVLRALKEVTLDDKLRSNLNHKLRTGVAGRGFGVELAAQGGWQ